MYREDAVTDGTCEKGFANLHAGDLSLDDAPRSGRPAETGSAQAETSTEKNQSYITWERADSKYPNQ